MNENDSTLNITEEGWQNTGYIVGTLFGIYTNIMLEKLLFGKNAINFCPQQKDGIVKPDETDCFL